MRRYLVILLFLIPIQINAQRVGDILSLKKKIDSLLNNVPIVSWIENGCCYMGDSLERTKTVQMRYQLFREHLSSNSYLIICTTNSMDFIGLSRTFVIKDLDNVELLYENNGDTIYSVIFGEEGYDIDSNGKEMKHYYVRFLDRGKDVGFWIWPPRLFLYYLSSNKSASLLHYISNKYKPSIIINVINNKEKNGCYFVSEQGVHKCSYTNKGKRKRVLINDEVICHTTSCSIIRVCE